MELISPEKADQIAILGAGAIGASWAALFVAKGKDVTLFDPDPGARQRVEQFIAKALPVMDQLGQLAKSTHPIRFVHSPQEAVREAQFVQESGPENLEAKRALFKQVDESLPANAIVASSTSGLLMTDIQNGRVGKERYIVGHPFNPPHLIPLVEVVSGKETDPQVAEWTMEFYRSLGKKPIRINREVPGHVANRLQAALWREAVHLVLEGVASAADVDAAVAYGPGLRWAIMGPHLIFHLGGGRNGIEGFLTHLGPSFDAWWRDLGSPTLNADVCKKLIDSVTEEARGRPIEQLERERDAKLLALLGAQTQLE